MWSFSGYIIYNRAGEKFYSKSDVFCRFLYRASGDIGSKNNPFRPVIETQLYFNAGDVCPAQKEPC